MERNEAPASAAGDAGAGRVDKRREHASFETNADVGDGKQLDAAARTGCEADLVVAAGAIPGEPEDARQERARAMPLAEFLESAPLPVIDAHMSGRRRREGSARHEQRRALMAERPFELHPVRERNVDDE